ncbi:MAG: substrate-binding domain-containing protein, partial [Oscillospiraceae bacterium]|nr:substrate-binding domain-containing protein [Oscillospiraceae bacterium]
IGLNDTPASSYSETPLTVIRSHIEEQCAIAAGLLKTKIFDRDYTTVQHIAVQNELIVRQTTALRRLL